MALRALASVIHRGRFYEPGDTLPDDVDAERLVRLGLAVAAKPAAPKRAPKRSAGKK